jgi:nucleoside-diphosphate-sugar epimerase
MILITGGPRLHRALTLPERSWTTANRACSPSTGSRRHGLPPGRNPEGPGQDTYLDISRIHQDTGYQPEYGVERGMADYINWLKAGHER